MKGLLEYVVSVNEKEGKMKFAQEGEEDNISSEEEKNWMRISEFTVDIPNKILLVTREGLVCDDNCEGCKDPSAKHEIIMFLINIFEGLDIEPEEALEFDVVYNGRDFPFEVPKMPDVMKDFMNNDSGIGFKIIRGQGLGDLIKALHKLGNDLSIEDLGFDLEDEDDEEDK